jgi:hypothetical protein
MPDEPIRQHDCPFEDTINRTAHQVGEIHRLLCGNGKVGLFESVRLNTWFRRVVFWMVGITASACIMTLVGIGIAKVLS